MPAYGIPHPIRCEKYFFGGYSYRRERQSPMKPIAHLLLLLATASCASAPSSIQRVTPLPQTSAPLVAQQPTAVASLTERAPGPFSATQEPGDLQSPFEQLFASAPAPTATPLSNDLPEGSAREIALATDTAMQVTLDAPLTFDESPVPITFDEFYDGYNLRTGLILSQKLLSLDGQSVVLEGYMAPPLKPALDYFVLTRIRLAFCPFCSNASDWPDDIALVYMPEGATTLATTAPVRVTGRIEIGASTDMETGMVSLVRVYVEQYEVID